MSEFNIQFTGEEVVDEGVCLAHLTLTLGSFVEGMDADLSTWSKADYELQWRSEILAIIEGQNRGALITSIHDPHEPYRVSTWPMWKEAETVYFQNQLLFMLEVGDSFELTLIRDSIGAREQLTEDGKEISTWDVPLRSLEKFVKEGM